MRTELVWVWLALPPLLAWVWWLSRKSYAQLSPRARIASAVARVLILIFLLGALSRPVWEKPSRVQHSLFLLDVSRSITRENLDAALTEIDRLAKEATASGESRVSVIAFAERPRQLVAPTRSWAGFAPETRDLVLHETSLLELNTRRASLMTASAPKDQLQEVEKQAAAVEAFGKETVGDHTDALAALRLALNTGETDEFRTIYLFTDACFTKGDWRSALDAVAAHGDALHTIALDKPLPPEVAATDLTIPATVRVNQSFTGDLRIASTVDTQARLAIFRDGYAAAEIPCTLKTGQNTIALPAQYFRDKGFHTIDVAVRADSDTRVENNRVRALVVVPGELRVLYVDSDEAQQSYLSSALGLEGVRVESRPASGVPRSLDELLGFDALILSNVPADRLSAGQMQMIRTYVQDFGGGFLMLGGDQSFGLGGYYNTPIEEILPVRMPIQKELNRPSLAIILVIDKSGSMTGAKIQLAKRAAIATSEAINPRDQIGLVGFDSEAQVVLELTPAGDRAGIAAHISTLDAGGGTFMYPALEIAQNTLRASNARRKHVIVLSDGQTEGFGYEDMAQSMSAEGITVSTVGIGEGADMKLLEGVAAAGAGRAYFTNDFHAIPQIFTREALRASNSMLVERLVLPTAEAEDESLSEIDASELPPLGGYVATTAKETATTIIISDAGDPILSKWRCGLGRAAAFTSDTKPRWAEDWIRWDDFAKFWAQLVRSVAGQNVDKDVSLDVRSEARDDGLRLTAEIRDAADNFVSDRTPTLMVHDAQGQTRPVPVVREAPGLFAATVPQGEFGKSQQFAWHLPGRAGGLPTSGPAPAGPPVPPGSAPPVAPAPSDPGTGSDGLTVPFGYVQSFSPEFRTLGVDRAVLEEIGTRKLGQVVSVGSAKMTPAPRPGRQSLPIWPALLIAALALVPIDILFRRLG
jgi:Mg-chelatase subunit ChlD/uncharacterized membrane protein